MAGWTWYGVGGWLLASAGLVLMLTYLFGRRILVWRHPRCAACGYRLDGLPASVAPAQCPECGRLAQPGEGFAFGRKRRFAVTGAILLAAGMLLPSVPTVRTQGWLAALPMGVQVRALAYSDDAPHWARVLQAGVSQRLSADQSRRVRAALLDRLASPDGDPTPAVEAILSSGLQRPWGRQAGMAPLTPAELLEAVKDGSPQTRSFVGRLLQIDTVPATPEEAALRRAGWRTASQHERVALLQAIAQYPAGDEDLAFIRSAFEADAWSAGLAISRSPVAPSVQALVSDLLEHPDWNMRRGAVMACEGWLRERDAKPPLELQRRLLTIVFSDPEPQVASLAARSIDNLSLELGAAIGAGLVSIDQPERFRSVLSGVYRRDDPAVIDGLPTFALEESRPVWQRLAAAEAFEYVSLRTRQPPAPHHFEDLYRLIVDALIAGDPELLIQIGRDDRVSNPAAFVLAVADKAALDGVGPDGLAQWFEANPGLAAATAAYAPEAATPRAAFESLLRDSLRRQTPNTVDRLNDVQAYWFPTKPESAEDGEGPG